MSDRKRALGARRVRAKVFTRGFAIFAAVVVVLVFVATGIKWLIDGGDVLPTFTTAAVGGAIVLLLAIGGRMIVPIFSGDGNKMLEMATMQQIGGIQAGERSTVFEQVHASPMEKGFLIDNDPRDEGEKPVGDPRLE